MVQYKRRTVEDESGLRPLTKMLTKTSSLNVANAATHKARLYCTNFLLTSGQLVD